MAQIRGSAIEQEHALGSLAAASPLADDSGSGDDEERDGGETPDGQEDDAA